MILHSGVAARLAATNPSEHRLFAGAVDDPPGNHRWNLLFSLRQNAQFLAFARDCWSAGRFAVVPQLSLGNRVPSPFRSMPCPALSCGDPSYSTVAETTRRCAKQPGVSSAIVVTVRSATPAFSVCCRDGPLGVS